MNGDPDDGCAALGPAFRVLDRLRDGDWHTLTALGVDAGIARGSVEQALERLADAGVKLERAPRRGVRWVHPVAALEASRIAEAMGAERGDWSLRVVRCVGSTNTVLRREAEAGLAGKVCLVADLQTAGRGRRGRAFLTGLSGALTFSVLWRTPRPLPELAALSLAVGVAIVRALRACGIGGATLKWPNDILWQDAKLGGVLTELIGEAGEPAAAIIGIGLNLRLDPELRQRIDVRVADVAEALGAMPDRNALLGALLKELADVLRVFDRDGFAPLRREWMAADAFRDSHVRLSMPDGKVVRGHACGVTEDGSLLLATAKGVERFMLGEISLRKESPVRS
jgi:BirA family transcriptional regulator, biotin operon repressor / biotin---[acetyl-CoA-carboxylase] ligase